MPIFWPAKGTPALRLQNSVGPHRHKLNVFPHKQISSLGPARGLIDVPQAGAHTKCSLDAIGFEIRGAHTIHLCGGREAHLA